MCITPICGCAAFLQRIGCVASVFLCPLLRWAGHIMPLVQDSETIAGFMALFIKAQPHYYGF